MELSEMIKVMQHYADRGDVEFSRDNFKTILGTVNKKYDGDLSWNWSDFDYRIKEPNQKITIEKWLCIDANEDYVIIEAVEINTYHQLEKVKLIKSYEVEL